MACDVNWLKLQNIIKQKSLEKQKKTNSAQKIEHVQKISRDLDDALALSRYESGEHKTFDGTAPSFRLLKKLGIRLDRSQNFCREDWEGDVDFDILPAPKILKRDRIFEQFLIDDQGYLKDEISIPVSNAGDSVKKQWNNNEVVKSNERKREEKAESVASFKTDGVTRGQQNRTKQLTLELPNSVKEPTKYVALDCEMVGALNKGSFSLLARVSIVNSHGHPIYDKYVKPPVDITDYRTEYSGITAEKLQKFGEPLQKVQTEVAKILKGRIVVGHSLANDLKVLFLEHPKKFTRDTSQFPVFRKLAGDSRKAPSLKYLSEKILGIQIQAGEHDSVQDAQAAMKLYMKYRGKWELWLKTRMAKFRSKEKLEVVKNENAKRPKKQRDVARQRKKRKSKKNNSKPDST